MWIWSGVVIVVIGTLIALLPNMKPAKLTVKEKEIAGAEAAHPGVVGVGGD
jgi:hypothetical protein